MIETTNDVKMQIWRDLIIAANNSDMSKREWCKANNIKKTSFYRWQKIIRENEISNGNIINSEQSLSVGSSDVTKHQDAIGTDITFVELPYINSEDTSVVAATESMTFRTDVAVSCGKYTAYLGNEISEQMLSRVLRAIANA